MPWLFGHVGKQLDKKAEFNFKIYDVTGWITNNCKTDNYKTDKMRNIFLQICRKWWRETSLRSHFVFSKSFLFNRVKASGQHFSFIMFYWTSTWKYKKTVQHFRRLIQRYAQFAVSIKESETSFSNTFCVWFSKKSIPYVMLY